MYFVAAPSSTLRLIGGSVKRAQLNRTQCISSLATHPLRIGQRLSGVDSSRVYGVGNPTR